MTLFTNFFTSSSFFFFIHSFTFSKLRLSRSASQKRLLRVARSLSTKWLKKW